MVVGLVMVMSVMRRTRPARNGKSSVTVRGSGCEVLAYLECKAVVLAGPAAAGGAGLGARPEGPSPRSWRPGSPRPWTRPT